MLEAATIMKHTFREGIHVQANRGIDANRAVA